MAGRNIKIEAMHIDLNFSKGNLIWIDLEMTGLDPDNDRVIEIATIVTDENLEHLVEGPNIVIHQSAEVLSRMDEWNMSHHNSSGLTALVSASREDVRSAEQLTLEFLARYVPEKASPMCGNSICQDRQFLRRYMPDLHAFFHYRNLDVSTIKELQKRWSPTMIKYKKTGKHRALGDTKESIAELKYYRSTFFKIGDDER